MSELITIAKKLMKTVTRVDSLYCAIKSEDVIRASTRGLALIDDVVEIAIKLLTPKEEET